MLHPVASEEVIQTALNPQRWAVPGQQGLSLGTPEHALLERSSVFGWRQYNLIQLVGKEKPRVRCRSHCPTFSFRERWVILSIVLSIWHPQTHIFWLDPQKGAISTFYKMPQQPHICHHVRSPPMLSISFQALPQKSHRWTEGSQGNFSFNEGISLFYLEPLRSRLWLVLIRFHSFTFPRHLL